MIEESSRCRNNKINTFGKLLRLGLSIRTSHDNSKRLRVVSSHDLLCDMEYLQRKLAGRGNDNNTGACLVANCQQSERPPKANRYEPFLGLNFIRCSSSMLGIKNAKVFPLPVRAAPNTSRPASRGGIVRAWTGVMRVIPIAAKPSSVFVDRSRELNEVSSRVVPVTVVCGGRSSLVCGAGLEEPDDEEDALDILCAGPLDVEDKQKQLRQLVREVN